MTRAIHRTKRLGGAVRTALLGWALIAGMVGYTFLLGARQLLRRSVRLGGSVVAAASTDAGTAGRSVYGWLRS